MEKWQCMSINEVEAKLNTSVTDGLSRKEAEHRVDEMIHNGTRSLSPLYCPQKKSALACILSPLSGIFFAIYLALVLFTVFDGREYLGIYLLVLFITMTVILGVMDMKAIRSKERANMYSIPTAKVIRSGRQKYTDSRNLAVGDIILFDIGDIICCDARLVSSDGLVVDEYVYNTSDGEVIRRKAQKNADIIYGEADETGNGTPQNILLAGSVVTDGSGQAIVTATATDTALASHIRGGEMNGDIKRPSSISHLLADTRKITVVISILLIIMTALGMIFIRSGSISDILLLTLSSVMFVSSRTVDMWSRIIFKYSTDKLHPSVIIKNNRTFDNLAGITDMLLLGRAGITDGRLHISSIFMSGRRLESSIIETKPDRVYRLCEYIYTYLNVVKVGEFPEIDEYRESLEQFMSEVSFDRDAASLKLGSRYFLDGSDPSGDGTAKASTKITISLDRNILNYCNALSVGDMTDTLSDSIRDRIEHYIDECEANGERLLFVVSEESESSETNCREVVLEGIAAFEEHIVEGIDQTLDLYRQKGIRVTALMREDSADNIKYLVNSGIVSSPSDKKIAFASDFAREGRSITSDFGRYRAYLGFSMTDYAKLVTHIKHKAGKVASYGTDDKFNSILTMTDVSVTCNCIEYDSDEYRQSLYESFPNSGHDTSALCSQRSRLCADILVQRSSEHGGLSAILDTGKAVCAGYINLAYFLRYFAVISSLVFLLVFMSAISGVIMLNAVHILILYLFISTVGLYGFSKCTPLSELTEKGERVYTSLPTHLVKRSLVSIEGNAITSVLCLAVSLILKGMGVVSYNGISFSSLVFVFAVALYKMYYDMREYTQAPRRNTAIKILTLVFIGFYVLILCISVLMSLLSAQIGEIESAFVSAVCMISNEVYDGAFDARSLMLIPIFIVIYISVNTAFALIRKYSRKRIKK